MAETVEIFVTTCKRPDWCLNLLKEIQQETRGVNYNVRVFHDKTKSDYSLVQAFCNENSNYYYYRTSQHMGRDNFWRTHNMMYTLLDTLNYDYFILLVDDMTLVKDFTQRAINLVKSEIDICNFGTVNVHTPNMSIKKGKIINGVQMYRTNWFDCQVVATKEAMQGIRVVDSRDHRIKYTGSWVANSFIKAYNAKTGNKIWQTQYALTEHLGIDQSAMHLRTRRFTYYGNVNVEKDPLRMAIAPDDYDYVNDKFKKLWKIQQSA